MNGSTVIRLRLDKRLLAAFRKHAEREQRTIASLIRYVMNKAAEEWKPDEGQGKSRMLRG